MSENSNPFLERGEIVKAAREFADDQRRRANQRGRDALTVYQWRTDLLDALIGLAEPGGTSDGEIGAGDRGGPVAVPTGMDDVQVALLAAVQSVPRGDVALTKRWAAEFLEWMRVARENGAS